MKNLVKAGLVITTLTICFVTALVAETANRWGDFCYDEKRWIYESEIESEANEARRDHIQSTKHLTSTYKCAEWNEHCRKNLNP